MIKREPLKVIVTRIHCDTWPEVDKVSWAKASEEAAEWAQNNPFIGPFQSKNQSHKYNLLKQAVSKRDEFLRASQ